MFMGFSRQECWSGLPFLSPGDLPDPGIKPRSPALQAYSSPSELQGKPDNYKFMDLFQEGNHEIVEKIVKISKSKNSSKELMLFIELFIG